jgi:uncharacterized repeat protein (TIGR04138 family)
VWFHDPAGRITRREPAAPHEIGLPRQPAMLNPSHSIAELLRQDPRYKFDAYVFVFEALNYAQNVLDMGRESVSEPQRGEEGEPEGPQRHVTGQELCEALRRYALQQYGYMAKAVLNSWGIYTTGDFGEIVFNLIRIGHMRKTPTDRREDFEDIYDFDTAFCREFKIRPID